MADSAAESETAIAGAAGAPTDDDGAAREDAATPSAPEFGSDPGAGTGNRRARALAVAVGLSLVGPIFAFVLGSLFGISVRATGISLPVVAATALLVIITIGFGLGGVAFLYLRVRPDLLSVQVPSLRDWLAALVGTGMMFGVVIPGAMAVTAVQRATGVEPAQNNVAVLAEQDATVLLVLIPLAFLVIGPGEELLYRGAVQGRLREAFGAPAAIGVASLLFAAIHFVALGGPTSGRFLTIGLLFLPATVLGAAYEYSGNLVVPALMHGAYNAVLFGLLYAFLKLDVPTEPVQGAGTILIGLPP
jgi:membrane protease YdiL (CAAX protease family)